MLTAMVNTVAYENSLAFYLKEREKAGKPVRAFWDYDENYPLTPEQVKPFSEMVVAWICPDNPEHKWRNTVKSISLGYGCSKCSKRYHRDTREWINAARAVHGDKYNYEKVVFVNTKTLVTIVCPKHGEFQQAPSEHLSGEGCRFCSHQAFHPLECLAAKSPEVAAQWDYELNKESGFTPETIGIDSVRKFWWHCTNGKPHSFKATIAKRVNGGMQCAASRWPMTAALNIFILNLLQSGALKMIDNQVKCLLGQSIKLCGNVRIRIILHIEQW